MTMMRHIPLALLLATPTLAQDQAQDQAAPPGCTDVVTIQSEACYLRRVYSCPASLPDGYVVAGYDADGLALVTWARFDGVVTFSQPDGVGPGTTLSAEPDPFDLDILLQTGSDMHDFTMSVGGKGGGALRYFGATILPGTRELIDGRDLQVMQRTETFVNPEGESIVVSTTSLFDAELGLLLNGRLRRVDTGQIVQNRWPVDYIFPGEPGASAVTPAHDCPD